MIPEEAGNFIASHVSQHAPKGTGHDAHHDGHGGGLSRRPRQVQPRGAKQSQAKRIRNGQQFFACLQLVVFEKSSAGNTQQQDAQQRILMLDPE